MDLSTVIIGPVVTEKAERLKSSGTKHTYTMRIRNEATKVEIQKAIKQYYDADVVGVRIIHVRPKTRMIGNGKVMEKRHRFKKALVTLAAKSKPLDLASFQTNS